MVQENEGIFSAEMEEIDHMEAEAQAAGMRRESSSDDQILQIVSGFEAEAAEEELEDCKEDPEMDPITDPSEEVLAQMVQARQSTSDDDDSTSERSMPPLQDISGAHPPPNPRNLRKLVSTLQEGVPIQQWRRRRLMMQHHQQSNQVGWQDSMPTWWHTLTTLSIAS